jgi:cell division protein FtsQ
LLVNGATSRASRSRRASLNRRRLAPFWKRLPPRTVVRAALVRGLRGGFPAILAMFGIGATVGGAVVGYRWLTGSPRFTLDSVELRGASDRARAGLERAMTPALGVNLFRVSVEAVERRLRAEPWVADVGVRRSLPDALIVEVVERRPLAVVDLGGLYLADESGRVFKRADVLAGEAAGLPVVTGIDRDDYRRAPEAGAQRVREAVDAAALYRANPARPALGEIHSDVHCGLTLFTRAPVIALRLGQPVSAALERRLASFDAAWAALTPGERDAASTFHLDRDERPLRVAVGFAQRGSN